jgi:hypothetical protein
MQSRLGPEIKESLVTISSTFDSSQTVAWQTHSRTGEILENLNHLRLNVDRSQPMLLKIHDRMEDMHLLTMETNRKATELQSNLPIQMRRLEGTIQNIIADLKSNTGTVSSMEMMENIEGLDARHPGSQGLLHGYELAIQNSKRKCIVNTRTYRTYIGNLNIRSITNYEETETAPSLDNKSSRKTLKTTQRIVNIHIKPSFFRLGAFFSTIHGQSYGQPAMDMKMRVYNIVRPDAPIFKACEVGDLSLVQRLFAGGLATPFDQLSNGHSLLDIVLQGMFSRTRHWNFSVRDLHQYYTLFEHLVNLGLDPGISRAREGWRKAGPALQCIAYLARVSPKQFQPIFTKLSRLVIEKSLQDPFLNVRTNEVRRYEQLGISQPLLLTRKSTWEIAVPTEFEIARIFNPTKLEFNSALRDDPTAQNCRNWLSSMDSWDDSVHNVYRQLCKVLRELKHHAFDLEDKSLGISFVEYTHALCNWFALILEFGFNIRIDKDDLLYFLDETHNLNLLRSLMRRVGRRTKPIDDFLEAKDGERCASLAYQLANLDARHPTFPHTEEYCVFSPYQLSAYWSRRHRERDCNYFEGELRYRQISKANWSDFVEKCSRKPRISRELKIPFIKRSSRIRFKQKALYMKRSWQASGKLVRQRETQLYRRTSMASMTGSLESCVSETESEEMDELRVNPISGLQIAWEVFFM